MAIFSENLDFVFAYNGSDPTQPWPTDEVVNMFIFDEPAEPVDCLGFGNNVTFPTETPNDTPTAMPQETGSSAFNNVGYSSGTALMLAGFMMALFW